MHLWYLISVFLHLTVAAFWIGGMLFLPLVLAFFLGSEYGTLLRYKLTLFLIMLLISGLHDFFFGRKALEEMQQGDNRRLKLLARWSGRLNLLLSLAIAFIGVVVSRGGVWP